MIRQSGDDLVSSRGGEAFEEEVGVIGGRGGRRQQAVRPCVDGNLLRPDRQAGLAERRPPFASRGASMKAVASRVAMRLTGTA